MSQRFYVNLPLDDGVVNLQGAEAHHLSAVCRLREGEQVYLFNGDGHEYRAEILAIDRREVQLTILEKTSPARELPFDLTLASPMPRGDRGQFLIEKLTELGVTRFVPLQTERTVLAVKENRREKLERHVIEASKQCGRNRLMKVDRPSRWHDFIRQPDLPDLRVFGDPSGDAVSRSWSGRSMVLAVGPEGGLTEDEVQAACAAGWCGVSLGDRILRVETAAIALVAVCAVGS